jgi:hypothetical protein
MQNLFNLLILASFVKNVSFQSIEALARRPQNVVSAIAAVKTFEEFAVVYPGRNAIVECLKNESCWHAENFDVDLSIKYSQFQRKLLIRSFNSSDIEFYLKRWKNDGNSVSLTVFSKIKIFSLSKLFEKSTVIFIQQSL